MTSSTAPTKSRISLVELIVLGVIVTVALSFLLPALPASRENARAGVCQLNLRRLDLAAAMQWEAKTLPLAPVTWTIDLLPYCQDIMGVDRGFDISGFPPRPGLLTCPSRPDTSDMPSSTHVPHYALVIDDQLGKSWEDVAWRFRDRPNEIEAGKPVWFVGVTLSFAEAKHQWETQIGPHRDGRYNQSDSKGTADFLPLPTASAHQAQN